jgi:hypothetical protein
MDFPYIFKRINLPGRLVSAPSTLTVGAMNRHYSKRTQSEETKHDLEQNFVRGISGRTFDLPYLLRVAFCVFGPYGIRKRVVAHAVVWGGWSSAARRNGSS